ncbi:hypothetical protein EDD17DRAFT_394987 [Pisolithus thermaeus]|nr:hypothetical protein EDD17DRAFT_394987 [Pisolithus thermaeus]
MDRAGPSQPRNRDLTASDRPRSAYEDDLFRILTNLGPDGTRQYQEYYDRRTRQGRRMTDHDVAMSVFLENAKDLEAIEEDRTLALAVTRDPHLEDKETTFGGPNPPRVHRMRAWGRRFVSLLNTWARTPVVPTTRVLPVPDMRRVSPPTTTPVWSATSINADTPAVPGVGRVPSPTIVPALSTASTNVAMSAVPDTRQMPFPTTIPGRSTTSTNAAIPAVLDTRPTCRVCIVCQDPVQGPGIRAPCGHYYDIPCIIDLFQSATCDESLYPPRCCKQNIPFFQVQPHFPRALMTQFREKSREFSTLNRVYCAQQTCSRFLGPRTDTTSGTAVYCCPSPNCKTSTCGSCKGRYDGWMHTCRQDQGSEQVLGLGNIEGWARCPGCSQVVELSMGCYHMTCRCRTEFCYLCRAKWKMCGCRLWDEQRLLAVAEQRVDAQLGGDEHHRHGRPPTVQPAPAVQPVIPAPASDVPRTPATQSSRTSEVLSLYDTQALDEGPTARPLLTETHTIHIRHDMIYEMVERLRIHHDCRHTHWVYRKIRNGGGRCENCHETLQLEVYLFVSKLTL